MYQNGKRIYLYEGGNDFDINTLYVREREAEKDSPPSTPSPSAVSDAYPELYYYACGGYNRLIGGCAPELDGPESTGVN